MDLVENGCAVAVDAATIGLVTGGVVSVSGAVVEDMIAGEVHTKEHALIRLRGGVAYVCENAPVEVDGDAQVYGPDAGVVPPTVVVTGFGREPRSGRRARAAVNTAIRRSQQMILENLLVPERC